MKTYARMVDGRRAQIISSTVDACGRDVPPLASRFPAEVIAQLVEYDPLQRPEPPPPTLKERTAALLAAVDRHVDAAAKSQGFDNRITFTMRAGYAGPHQAAALSFAQWMDACYERCELLQQQFNAGEIAEPTPEELIAMLPVLELPPDPGGA